MVIKILSLTTHVIVHACYVYMYMIHHVARVAQSQWLTCNTRLDKPVFCASCFRSLASGFWLMLKYDFIVRSWWCLNDVRMRFVRVCCCCCCCDMLPVPMVEEFVGEDRLDVSYVSDSIDEDKSVACMTSAQRKSTLNHAEISFRVVECCTIT